MKRNIHFQNLLARRKTIFSLTRDVLSLSGFVLLVFLPGSSMASQEGYSSSKDYIEFNDAFMGSDSSATVDIARFERGNSVPPGTYNIDIFVNERLMVRKSIIFKEVSGTDIAQPCFNYELLLEMGIDVNKLDEDVANPHLSCIFINDLDPKVTVSMNLGQLRLDVLVPQALMLRHARGYVNPQLWDEGIPALLIGYNFNAYAVNQKYNGSQSSTGGQAISSDGSPVSVRNGTYYSQTNDGTYTPNKNGTFMLSSDGNYVAVRPGSYKTSKQNQGYDNVNAYLGLNTGLNIEGWRLRNQGNAVWDRQSGQVQWSNIGTTISHDITLLKAQATFGQTYTQGAIFDSTSFRGGTLFSDERMIPDSQQGYAPVVRGTAKTRARVELRQNGNLIYETNVAPGPFVIDDLYSTTYSGDILVTIFEADGGNHSFVVPYSSVPMLLRPGNGRWSLTGGQVNNQSSNDYKLSFIEGTYQRGINNWVTMYSGVQAANDSQYTNTLVGIAFNTPVGAFSTDFSRAKTQLGKVTNSGDSFKLAYSKTIPTSETTFTLATYRYSSGGYFSLSDAAIIRSLSDVMDEKDGSNIFSDWRNKQRIQLTLSQNLGGRFGSLYFNGLRNSYWGNSAGVSTYQLGYSNSWNGMTYGITAGRTYTTHSSIDGSRFDNQFGLNIMFPLGLSSANAPTLTLAAQHDGSSPNSSQASLNGIFGKTNQYNYNTTINHQNTGRDSTTVSGGLGWIAPYANLNSGASYSENYTQSSLSASGGMVLHKEGITFSPQLDLNSPIALINAPNAQGATVTSGGTTHIDSRGYAIATGLAPYRINDVTLDPTGTSMDVELKTTRLLTAPRAGAVVPLAFETESGVALLIHAVDSAGRTLPLGADIFDNNQNLIGMVGQGGQIFVRTGERHGIIQVRWGKDKSQNCHISYNLSDFYSEKEKALVTLSSICKN
ncbi:fimbria/pilus outer membrane usher protein [Enterobacter cloacae]|uniref:fimbria/pilus outer membrane usher protein n=2 Tax=Enterobacter TaxID=547 RepID=UPI0028F07C44|nr:fimbria/pilus outer membrane usher protein [Enterobacter cloacae]WNT38001.1 fimbria/pilus outer membrane usher protein [Enterobacter cloacae]HDR2794116.1 fimbrial biogenesis outer membrane usher protein [Enterobacter asburiae]HDR2799358.1 fimbrial biogenesis outer membrane usher protein [Enterobacter asburiae]